MSNRFRATINSTYSPGNNILPQTATTPPSIPTDISNCALFDITAARPEPQAEYVGIVECTNPDSSSSRTLQVFGTVNDSALTGLMHAVSATACLRSPIISFVRTGAGFRFDGMRVLLNNDIIGHLGTTVNNGAPRVAVSLANDSFFFGTVQQPWNVTFTVQQKAYAVVGLYMNARGRIFAVLPHDTNGNLITNFNVTGTPLSQMQWFNSLTPRGRLAAHQIVPGAGNSTVHDLAYLGAIVLRGPSFGATLFNPTLSAIDLPRFCPVANNTTSVAPVPPGVIVAPLSSFADPDEFTNTNLTGDGSSPATVNANRVMQASFFPSAPIFSILPIFPLTSLSPSVPVASLTPGVTLSSTGRVDLSGINRVLIATTGTPQDSVGPANTFPLDITLTVLRK